MENQFYSLQSAFKSNSIGLEPIEPFDDVSFFTGRNGRYLFKCVFGNKKYDILTGGFAYIFIVSEKFIDALGNNFSGWKQVPLEIQSENGESMEGYFGLAVKGVCGPIKNELSKKVILHPRTKNGPSRSGYIGLYFDESTWDGSDVFSPANSNYIFITGKVKNELERSNLTNILIEPIGEIENLSVDLF
ncbi:MAG: hypothetical protein AAF843_20905 [Bacteroidota bacterium]